MTIYVGCYGFVLIDHYGLYGFSYAYEFFFTNELMLRCLMVDRGSFYSF